MSTALEFEFRAASNADASQIWVLISTVLHEYGIVASRATTDRDLTDVESKYWEQGGAFYVLLDGSTVIGSVALQRLSETKCELCRMYLVASHRGRGLGRSLFARAEAEAKRRGFTEMRLETSRALTEAIALYASVGFTIVHEAPDGKNCDLVMSKHLVGSSCPPKKPSLEPVPPRDASVGLLEISPVSLRRPS